MTQPPELAALTAELRANPSDTLRLAIADWCFEHDMPQQGKRVKWWVDMLQKLREAAAFEPSKLANLGYDRHIDESWNGWKWRVIQMGVIRVCCNLPDYSTTSTLPPRFKRSGEWKEVLLDLLCWQEQAACGLNPGPKPSRQRWTAAVQIDRTISKYVIGSSSRDRLTYWHWTLVTADNVFSTTSIAYYLHSLAGIERSARWAVAFIEAATKLINFNPGKKPRKAKAKK